MPLTTKGPQLVGTKKMDLVSHDKRNGIVGLVAEFKYLRAVKLVNAENLRVVWKEGFFQTAWYLAGTNFLCGNRLAMVVVNTSYQRLFIPRPGVLAIEVAEPLAAQSSAIRTLDDLDKCPQAWEYMPNEFLPGGNVDEAALQRYWTTFAQGARFTSMLREGVIQASTHIPLVEAHVLVAFNTPDKLRAAELKKLYESGSKQARSIPSTPSRSPRQSPTSSPAGSNTRASPSNPRTSRKCAGTPPGGPGSKRHQGDGDQPRDSAVDTHGQDADETVDDNNGWESDHSASSGYSSSDEVFPTTEDLQALLQPLISSVVLVDSETMSQMVETSLNEMETLMAG